MRSIWVRVRPIAKCRGCHHREPGSRLIGPCSNCCDWADRSLTFNGVGGVGRDIHCVCCGERYWEWDGGRRAWVIVVDKAVYDETRGKS